MRDSIKKQCRGGREGGIKSHEVYEETEGSDFKKGFPEEIRFDS